MFCATPVIKPGRARIGRITKTVTLPRTVEVVTLAAAAVGGFTALLLMLIFTRSWQSLAVAFAAGSALGWISTTYSPLEGESMAKWLGLKVATRNSNRIKLGTKTAVVHVGIAPVNRVAEGNALLALGATDVPAGSVDGEGRLSEKNALSSIKDETGFNTGSLVNIIRGDS